MKKTRIDEILDHICEKEGLPDHHSARRWLREQKDRVTREAVIEAKGVQRQGIRGSVKHENPFRRFVDEFGNTICPEQAATSEPEIHIPSGETSFQKSLAMRLGQRTPTRVPKPRKRRKLDVYHES